ncbi:hypothetical protein CCR75_008327 [Bremia lactucae]|uniref:RING-type E3 ubiquitin transferase n=1 Tax=Bremia lactucae TaxID=4779 RepID=A0A976FJL8_BRELC|nr:hypothetical protein CCR75_008327 [Bremia lactucae]
MEPRNTVEDATKANEDRKPLFECNICLDTVCIPVVTLCGHLYWYAVHRLAFYDPFIPLTWWMQHHFECPVCKAGVSEQNVVPVYARGAEAADPRIHYQASDSGIPRRPQGQRPDAERLRRRGPFNFGIFDRYRQGNAVSMWSVLFGVPYQPPASVTHHVDGTPLTAQEAHQQMQQTFLSRFLLIVGSLVILCLITF